MPIGRLPWTPLAQSARNVSQSATDSRLTFRPPRPESDEAEEPIVVRRWWTTGAERLDRLGDRSVGVGDGAGPA